MGEGTPPAVSSMRIGPHECPVTGCVPSILDSALQIHLVTEGLRSDVKGFLWKPKVGRSVPFLHSSA